MTRSWILKIEPNRGRPPSCQVYSTEYLEYIIFCKAIYLLLVNTGSSGNAATSVKNGMRPVSAGLIEHEANGSSQYCPRHHHHTTQTPQQPQQRQTPSPNKRHRLTPRPPNIQRPCLDFEKMQQIKKHVVTSWRPQGAELSLFCWWFTRTELEEFSWREAKNVIHKEIIIITIIHV